MYRINLCTDHLYLYLLLYMFCVIENKIAKIKHCVFH